MKISISRVIFITICFLLFGLNGAYAQSSDADKLWTTVGSTGTLDESAVGKIFFDKSIAQMGRVIANPPTAKKSALAAPTQSATIRYNVVPVDGLFTLRPPACRPAPGVSCPAYIMIVRFLAAGAGARVNANLIEVDLATGAESTLISFASSGASSNIYRVQTAASCGPGFFFDFRKKGYYIDATLTTSAILTGSAAGIQMIKISTDKCFG